MDAIKGGRRTLARRAECAMGAMSAGDMRQSLSVPSLTGETPVPLDEVFVSVRQARRRRDAQRLLDLLHVGAKLLHRLFELFDSLKKVVALRG